MLNRSGYFSLLIFFIVVAQIPVFPQEIPIEIESEHDVIIIGGGWHGFTAAYFLRDYDVKVLERSSKPGWSCRTNPYEMFPYESETEGYEQPPLSKMIDSLGLEIWKIPSPVYAYKYNGEYYFDLDGLASMLIEQSNVEEFNRFVNTVQSVYQQYHDVPELDFNSPVAQLDDISAAQWFTDHLFSQAYSERYNVICRRYFGANLSEISALSLLAKIGNAFKDFEPVQADSNNKPAVLDEPNAYVIADEYAVPEAMASFFGNIIQSHVNVLEVIKDENRYIVTCEDESKQRHALAARTVILTAPASDVAQVAPSLFSQEQIERLDQIPYRSSITLQLYSEQPIFDHAFDLSVQDDLLFTDIFDDQWVIRDSDPATPIQGNSLTLFLSPKRYSDEEFFDIDFDAVDVEEYLEQIMFILQELNKVFPDAQDIPLESIFGFVTYYNYETEPFLPVGAYHRMKQLHESCQNGLILSGNYMIYPDFEGEINSGYWAAQYARDYMGKPSGILNFEVYD